MQDHQNFTYVPNDHVSHSLMCRILGIWTKSMPALCTSKRINKCSRHKTYNFGDPGEQLYGESGTYEGKLLQNNFGMVPKLIVKPADGTAGNLDGAQTAEGCAVPWDQWQPPQPGHAKRLDDFRGYWKNATPHIKSLTFSSGSRPQLMMDKVFTATMKFYENNGRIVTLNDMSYGAKSIGQMYFTVAIASYTPSSVLPSGSKVAATWGAHWIIAQSAITLNDAVIPPAAGSQAPNEIAVTVPSMETIAALGKDTTPFQRHFIAVGFAEKFTDGASVGTNAYYHTPESVSMPLTLINPNMYNDSGYTVATTGLIQADISGGVEEFEVTAVLRRNSSPAASCTAYTTPEGVRGYLVDIACEVVCDVTSFPVARADDGYLTFDMTIDIRTENGKTAYKSVFVPMKMGFADASRTLIMTKNPRVISINTGFADKSAGYYKDSMQWYKDHMLTAYQAEVDLMTVANVNAGNDQGIYQIFIPLDDNTNATVTRLVIEVFGAPTPKGTQGAWLPKLKNPAVLDFINPI